MRSVSISKFTSIKISAGVTGKGHGRGGNGLKAWKTRRWAKAWGRVVAKLFMKGYAAAYLARLFRVSVFSVYAWAAKYCRYKIQKATRSFEMEMVSVTRVRVA